MRKERRRPMYFTVHRLHDGTVLVARPIRKPSKQELTQTNLRIDPDGVAREFAGSGRELSDVNNDTRTRFQEIIATNLNTRRAIRDLLLPQLAETLEEVQSLHARLDRLEALLTVHGQSAAASGEPPPRMPGTQP